jgi:hypothetical protein
MLLRVIASALLLVGGSSARAEPAKVRFHAQPEPRPLPAGEGSSARTQPALNENLSAKSNPSTTESQPAFDENLPAKSNALTTEAQPALNDKLPAKSNASTTEAQPALNENLPAKSNTSTTEAQPALNDNLPAKSNASTTETQPALNDNLSAKSSASTTEPQSVLNGKLPAKSNASTTELQPALNDNLPAGSNASTTESQPALNDNLPAKSNAPTTEAQPASAWIDLRQTAVANSKTQSAPDWVESVTLGPAESKSPIVTKSVFRIRVSRPKSELQVLMFRLFFDDNPKALPELVAWDESGSQVLRSGPLGAGFNLSTSETIIIPMASVSRLDVEVPGDGSTVRGVYLDWMTRSEVVHPVNAEHRDVIPEPFGAAAPLHAPETDTELFGTVTATLTAEALPMGPSVQQGAAFQFGIEAEPLLALLTFEVASPKVEAPPEVYLNGENIGPVNLVLPELADPGYRGEMVSLVKQMQFQYTGWMRAQKVVPISLLKVGTNDLLVISGAGTAVSAIRATQLQLKYLWDKSDYVLRPIH